MGRKLIVTILIACFFCLGSLTEAQAFVDVRNHWSAPAVEHLGTRELIKGYADGRFMPDRNITRAEMCRLLTGMLAANEAATSLSNLPSVFSDITSNHWARGDINYLYEQGVVTGDEKGHFNPDALLRRDEAMVMLLRALRVETSSNPDNLVTYKDVNEVPEFALGFIARGLKDGFITGYPDSTLRPASPITRAELAVLVERGLDYKGNEYQYWGQLLQVDRVSNKVQVIIGTREERWLTLAPNMKIYNLEGQAVSVYSLGVPYRIYFDLDQYGRLVYARAFSTDPANRIRIEQRRIAGENDSPIIPLALDSPLQLYESSESPTNGYKLAKPETSIEVNKTDMNLPELATKTGANGRDVLVAVIDTGVDPGHPDLQITTNGQRKVVDYIDYTDEGRVVLPNKVSITDGWENRGVKTDLSRVKSVSGKVKIGYWDEARYDSTSVLSDFNGNGTAGDKVLVVAADRAQAGIYDTIYVDSNGNGDIRDEIPLQAFRDSKQYAVFATADGWGFNYVLSSMATDGSYAQFGFDSQGHGTHVAGIIAAHGQMEGLAPDARLIVIKVAGSNGDADPQALYLGLKRAAEMGAQVANVSMGASGHPELAEAVNQLTRKYGTVFSIAVGNSGPGMGTITSPGSADEALRVGAYVSPQQWQTNYGWKVNEPTLWYFSSLGPRTDGALGPMLVAPGSVYSTTPLWQKAKYRLDEGTSMAAPHLSGAIAVLMDALMRNNQVISPGKIRNSLLMSAKSLSGYSLVEQGYGAVDLMTAYQTYASLSAPSALRTTVISNQTGDYQGLYARSFSPGTLPVVIQNNERRTYNLNLSSDFSPAQIEQERLLLPGQGSRTIGIDYNLPDQPGLYSGFINGDDSRSTGVELRIPQVLVVPYDLTVAQPQYNLDGILSAGMVQHYFFRIPANSGRFNAVLRVPQLNKQYMGRVRLHLFNPDGQEITRTGYAGHGAPGESGSPEVQTSIDKPMAGVWELVVYSNASLSLYQDDASEYSLAINLESPGDLNYISDQRYLVTSVPATIAGNNTITLQIRESEGLKPYTGTVLVDEKLYYVQDGQLQIPRPPENNPHIYLTWQ